MKQEEKINKPKNDVIFKNLFSKVGNEDLLKEFLEEILGIKIKKIEIQKEVELNKNHTKEKVGRLDLRVKINENAIVVIEMQLQDKCKMRKRAMYYASKIMASSLEVGQTYEQIKDMYVISILDYNMLETEEYNTDTVIVDSKYRKYVVIDGIKFYFIELPKFREQVRKPKTKLEEWLTFIDYEDMEMVNMAIAQNKLVAKAQKEYEYLTGDEATKRWQFLREKAILDERAAYINGKTRGKEEGEIVGEARGKIIGEKCGEKRGKIIGEREGRIKTAIELMKNNINIDIIVKCTGLNKKELEELLLEKV